MNCYYCKVFRTSNEWKSIGCKCIEGWKIIITSSIILTSIDKKYEIRFENQYTGFCPGLTFYDFGMAKIYEAKNAGGFNELLKKHPNDLVKHCKRMIKLKTFV